MQGNWKVNLESSDNKVARASVNAIQQLLQGNVKKMVEKYEYKQPCNKTTSLDNSESQVYELSSADNLGAASSMFDEELTDDDVDSSAVFDGDQLNESGEEDNRLKPKELSIDLEQYYICCKQIEQQIKKQTDIQLQPGCNLSYDQYCQLQYLLDGRKPETIDVIFRPRVLLINNNTQAGDNGAAGTSCNPLDGDRIDMADTIDDHSTSASDKPAVQAIRVANEEIFVYTNQLSLGLSRRKL